MMKNGAQQRASVCLCAFLPIGNRIGDEKSSGKLFIWAIYSAVIFVSHFCRCFSSPASRGEAEKGLVYFLLSTILSHFETTAYIGTTKERTRRSLVFTKFSRFLA